MRTAYGRSRHLYQQRSWHMQMIYANSAQGQAALWVTNGCTSTYIVYAHGRRNNIIHYILDTPGKLSQAPPRRH